MADFDDRSAIDDSGPYHHFDHTARAFSSAPHAHGTKPTTNENLQIHGPRSGQWSVSSGSNLSAIDPGSDSVFRAPGDSPAIWASRGHTTGATRRSRPIAGGLLRELHEATLAEREVRLEQRDKEHAAKAEEVKASERRKGTAASGVSAAIHARKSSEPEAKFRVPAATDRRGIKISGRDGQKVVVREPKLPPTSPVVIKQPGIQPRSAERHVAASRHSNRPPSPSHKTGSTASRTRRVRIQGRNGEEAIVYLPSISPVRAPQVSKKQKDRPPAMNVGDEQKKQQDRAAKAARELQAQREREADARIAAEALMSGALQGSVSSSDEEGPGKTLVRSPPISSRGPADVAADWYGAEREPLQSRLSSSRSRSATKSGVGNIFDTSDFGSKTSSKTSIASSEVRSKGTSSQHSRDDGHWPQQSGWQELGADFVRNAHPSKQSWQSMKEHENYQKSPSSWNRKPQSAASDRRSDKASFSLHDSNAHEAWPSIKAPHPSDRFSQSSKSTYERGFTNTRSPSHCSSSQHIISPSAQSSHPSEARPTIYAGIGWISPHPLSVASSEYHGPPQSAIRLPSRDGIEGAGDVLTFAEWENARRGAGSMGGSSYGRRSQGATEEEGGGWEGYRGASVASVLEGSDGSVRPWGRLSGY